MLVEDTTAFIEHLEVYEDDRRVEKVRRRLARAELEAMRLEIDARVAAEALRAVAHELASLRDDTSAPPGRRLLRDRRERALVRELAAIRGRLRETRETLEQRRERVRRLREVVAGLDDADRCARVIRLHSAEHHIQCSEKRFARLARRQFVAPVLLTKRDGRRWWWYADRFWWADRGLSAREIEAYVLRADQLQSRRADEVARARAAILGEEQAPSRGETVSAVVRFAVRCRDRGRCVDCGTSDDVGYDQIVPYSKGGWRWIANVELRCASCRERRRHNEERTRVGRARVEAVSALH